MDITIKGQNAEEGRIMVEKILNETNFDNDTLIVFRIADKKDRNGLDVASMQHLRAAHAAYFYYAAEKIFAEALAAMDTDQGLVMLRQLEYYKASNAKKQKNKKNPGGL